MRPAATCSPTTICLAPGPTRATGDLLRTSVTTSTPTPATRPRRSTPNGGQSSRSPRANDQAFAQNAGGSEYEHSRGARRPQGPRQHEEKARVLEQVTAGETVRLLREAEQPLQAAPRHPQGSPLDATGEEVERGSDCDRYRGADDSPDAVDPELLLGGPERYEHQVRARVEEALHDAIVRRLAIELDGGAVHADDLHADLTLETPGGGSGDAGGPAQEVDAPAAVCGQVHQGKHQVRPGDLLGQRNAEQARGPDQRLAIRERQARGGVRFAKGRVVLGGHDVVHVWRKDGCSEPADDEPLDLGKRLGKGQSIDPNVTETHALTVRRASAHYGNIVSPWFRVKGLGPRHRRRLTISTLDQ